MTIFFICFFFHYNWIQELPFPCWLGNTGGKWSTNISWFGNVCLVPSAAFPSLAFPKHCFHARATLQPPAQEGSLTVDVFSSLRAPRPQALQQLLQLLWEDGGVGKRVFWQEAEGWGAARLFCPSWSKFKVLAEGNVPTLFWCSRGLGVGVGMA